MKTDVERFDFLADNGAAVLWSNYLCQISIEKKIIGSAYIKKPEKGQAVIHASKGEALRVAIDNAMVTWENMAIEGDESV